MNSESIRALLQEQSLIRGSWMPVYLQTVPGSDERICVAVAAVGLSGESKVVRTLQGRAITTLFGPESNGINHAIDWITQSLQQHISSGGGLEEWQLPVSGFVTGSVKPSGAASLDGLLEKAVNLSTALGSAEPEEERQQRYFATRFKEQLYRYNPEYKRFIDQRYKLNRRTVKFGVVTDHFIANYHGINTNTASYNAALAKMVLLEDLKLEGLVGSTISREFLIACSDGADKKAQSKLISDLEYELHKRDITTLVYDNATELANSLSRRLSAFV